jgi:hypothetical protein
MAAGARALTVMPVSAYSFPTLQQHRQHRRTAKSAEVTSATDGIIHVSDIERQHRTLQCSRLGEADDAGLGDGIPASANRQLWNTSTHKETQRETHRRAQRDTQRHTQTHTHSVKKAIAIDWGRYGLIFGLPSFPAIDAISSTCSTKI